MFFGWFSCDMVYIVFKVILRADLLFPKDHPIVLEDIERLKQTRLVSSQNIPIYDLDWESEPEQENPKWLKQQWKMMRELKAPSLKKLGFQV